MTDLLPCPFCGAPASTPQEAEAGMVTKCSVRDMYCPGAWWCAIEHWNRRAIDQKAMFEQFVVSLTESERKLKIAQEKLAAIEAAVKSVKISPTFVGQNGLAIVAISKILGASDE